MIEAIYNSSNEEALSGQRKYILADLLFSGAIFNTDVTQLTKL
jgi:hypothetical protein